MTVEQRLMKPGAFMLKLRGDAPVSLRQAVREFDHIVVMPTPFDPTGYSDASILAAAAYTGVVTTYDTKTGTITGAGLAHWLGTADGMGDLLDVKIVSSGAWTLTQWVTALCPASLTVGTVTNTTTLDNSTVGYQYITRREALDNVCLLLGAEWRVNNNFTLDVGPVASLFRTTPIVMVTEREEAQFGGYRGLDGSFTNKVDVTKYATAVIVVAGGSGSTVATAAATSGATTYRDGLGNIVVMEAMVNAPATATASAATAATNTLAKLSAPARQLTIGSTTYGVTQYAHPGDSVYAFDIEAQLVDMGTQITYRGEQSTPTTERVFALTWPIEQGMSVFARRSTGVGTFTYTDLTTAVEYETGDVRWEVGAINSTVAPDPTMIGAAYLGVAPAIQTRLSTQALSRRVNDNGCGEVSQRGRNVAGANTPGVGYQWTGVDRWSVAIDGTGTRTMGQQVGYWSLGDQTFETAFYINNITSVTGQTFNVVRQFMEGAQTLANEPFTLSAWIYPVPTLCTSVSAQLYRHYGSGGSPSAADYGMNSSATLIPGQWNRVTFSGVVPTVTSKTFGTNNDSSLSIILGFPSNMGAGITYITGVQLERGTVATPYEFRHPALELANCQRYFGRYQYLKMNGVNGSGAANSAVGRFGTVLPVTMRNTNAFLPVSIVNGPINVYDGNNAGTIAAVLTNYSIGQVVEFDATMTISAGASPRVITSYVNASWAIDITAEVWP